MPAASKRGGTLPRFVHGRNKVPGRVGRRPPNIQKQTQPNKKVPGLDQRRTPVGRRGTTGRTVPKPGNKSLEMVTIFLQNSLDKWFQKGYNLVASKQQSFFMCSSPPFDPRLSLRRGFPLSDFGLSARCLPGAGGLFCFFELFCRLRRHSMPCRPADRSHPTFPAFGAPRPLLPAPRGRAPRLRQRSESGEGKPHKCVDKPNII